MFIKRFSCSLVALAVLFCVSCPVFASGMELGGLPVSLEVQLDVVDFFNYCRDDLRWCYNSVKGRIDGETCPYAPTAGGAHKFQAVRTLVNGQVGLQWQCEYCHKNYGEAAEMAYQEYVQELPGTTYNSSGKFLWVPGSADFVNGVSVTIRYMSNGALVLWLPTASGIVTGAENSSLAAYVGDYLLCSKGNLSMSWDSNAQGVFSDWRSVRVPVSGIYTRLDGVFASDSAGAKIINSAYSAGAVISLGSGIYFYSAVFHSASSVRCPWPKFWVQPYTGGGGGNTYEITTRFSGSGNAGSFGYVENGNLVQSSVGTIYNEETNIYQNPVTGDTSNISSWSYDYGDRSYSLTTNEGGNISVTYGDSAVTINEGGTTYNVLYLVEEPDGGAQEAVYNHTHTYSGSVTTPPTCTGAGVRTLTCTECGWQTTETIPATGHSYSASIVTREPTCTAPGLRTGTCTICGDEATEAIPATGHSYSSSVTTAPTCILTGVRTYTCAGCGDTYTETIPATGHVWQVVRTVPTEYDDVTGELTQEGYTLYQCSSCGEQYRIDSASGGSSLPAPSSGGVSVSGETDYGIDSSVGRGLLATIAHGLIEDLPEALKAASEMFTVLPAFYAGFTSFLKDGVAGCMPDVPRLMMGFGMGMVTFIGILRKIFGR